MYFVPGAWLPRGNRATCMMQHGKLSDAKAAERMKAYWAETLERLKGVLEA